MPGYELSVVFKTLARPELSAALKRIGTLLLDKQTVLQKIENHGVRDLPYRITKLEDVFSKGHFFTYYFVSSRSPFFDVKDECRRDVDIIRFGIVSQHEDFTQECTLDAELQPPAYRESVQKLIEQGNKLKEKRKLVYKHIKHHEYFDVYM